MTVVSDVEIRLRADIARLQQDLNGARREVTGAVSSMSNAVEKFKGVLGGLAAGAAVAGFAGIIKNSIDAADALNDMSARTKVAIEDLAGLSYAAKLGDTSLEGVAASISKLGMNIGKDGAKFRELGITATEPLEAFKQLADVFKDIQDPQQRAAFGAEALGKSWQEAAVLLEGGSEGISTLVGRGKELSGITGQVAADAGAFNDKLDELGTAAQGAGVRIAASLLPTLQKIADSFSSSAASSQELQFAISTLSLALKGLTTIGIGVTSLFQGFGKSIGGAAAVLERVLEHDISGAMSAYKEMATDVYSGLGDAAKRIGNLWSDTGKTVTKTAEETATAVGNSTAKVAAFLNAGDVDAARKKSAADAVAAAKKEESAYAGLIASIKEKMAADELEIAGAAAVTPVQQARIKLDQEMAAGKLVLTEKHKEEAYALLDTAEALEHNANAAKQSRAAVAALADEREKSYAALVSEAEANEELIKTYGKTKLEIAQMTLARDEDRLSQRGALDLSEDTVAQLEREIEARKRNIAAMGSLEVLDKQKKASEDAAAAQVDFWKSIDKTAHDTFVSIANGSKDTAQRLKDTFKNVFFDWLYQQTIRKWIINIGTATDSSAASSIAGALGGGTSGAGGIAGLFGSGSNLVSIGKMIYSGFSGGIASSLGSTFSSLGATFGSEAISAFGAGLTGGSLGAGTASAASGYAGTTAAGFGASAASAIPIIGWIIAGMQAANSFAKQGFTPNNGTISNPLAKAFTLPTNFAYTSLEKLGVGSTLANILSGAAINTKLFGRADPRVESQGLRGTINAAGVDAESYANIIEKGGLFRSSKRYQRSADLAAETDTAWDEQITGMIAAVKSFGGVLGVQTDAINTYTKSFDIKTTGDAAKDNEAIAKLFAEVGDELAMRLVPNLATFQAEGESLAATLQRVTANYSTVDSLFQAIGKTVGAVGVAGITAREGLIAAAGGLQNLSSGISYFQQNFLTEAQQLAPVQKAVAEQLAAMGQSGLKTNEQFAAATLAIDTSTEAGAKLFAQMLALAPAFKQVTDAADQSAAALKAAEEALTAGLVDAARAAFSSLADVIDAQKDKARGVLEAALSTIDAGIDAASARISKLKSLSDLLAQPLVSSGSQGASYAAARAQVTTALAIAKASGVLPDADSLRDALAAVRGNDAASYTSQIEYLRDQAAAGRDIKALGGLTKDQLSVEERTLQALQDQRVAAQMASDS